MRAELARLAAIGRDVWLIDPRGEKHLPPPVDFASELTTLSAERARERFSLPTPPEIGVWRCEGEFLLCGSVRVARTGLATNLPVQSLDGLLGWVCRALNAISGITPNSAVQPPDRWIPRGQRLPTRGDQDFTGEVWVIRAYPAEGWSDSPQLVAWTEVEQSEHWTHWQPTGHWPPAPPPLDSQERGGAAA